MMKISARNIVSFSLSSAVLIAMSALAWLLMQQVETYSNQSQLIYQALIIIVLAVGLVLHFRSHFMSQGEETTGGNIQSIIEDADCSVKELQRAIIRIKAMVSNDNIPMTAAMTGLLEAVKQRIETLEKDNADLSEQAHEATHRTQSLETKYQNLEVAPQQRSEFLSRMGDEITTPMNSLRTMLRLISKAELNQETRDLLKIAIHSAHSLIENINNILEFSKLDAGLLELQSESFDLQESIRRVLETQESIALSKSLLIEKHISPDVPDTLTAPRRSMMKILDNLISNAIRFTDKGFIDLKVDTLNEDSRQYVRFRVIDTGVGIPEAAQANLFDSLDKDTELQNSSFTGRLRLIVCKQLCELMGGEIGVKSTQGKGSEFWFTVRLN